jgi:microcystin-dependent protein
MAYNDVFVGQILLVPFSFPPIGFAFCNGQMLPISQNTALFSLIGTTYGGDGKSTFALPNLQGRVPLHEGQGPGLTERLRGETGGSEAHPLTVSEMPAHTHTLTSTITAAARCRNVPGNQTTPVGNGPAIGSDVAPPAMSSLAANSNMQAGSIVVNSAPTAAVAGEGTPHNNMGPYLTLNFVIALQGIFPCQSC